MIFVSDLRVILNKIQSFDLETIPDQLKVEIEGQSPSIFDGSHNPPRRIQGLVLKISGNKKDIDQFLKQFESTGVYLK